MTLKKKNFNDNEIAVFDNAVIYKRGDYWQFRMWLEKEKKYARFSLKTRNQQTAEDKAKTHFYELMANQHQGRTYFSKTTKEGVQEYLKQRAKDLEAGLIVKGRLSTIKTHLEHWLDFIHRDTKLKELERTDCENYYHSRTKSKKKLPVGRTTILNEQSSINAMMSWLYKNKETYIESFEFKKLKPLDTGIKTNRRSTFNDSEMLLIKTELKKYIKEAESDINHEGNLSKAITGYYLGFSYISGLRRGEQLQLRWSDVYDMEHKLARNSKNDLIRIVVRGETSKVRKTRELVVKDDNYFGGLLELKKRLSNYKGSIHNFQKSIEDNLVFSLNGTTPITPRAIGYHFDRLVENANIKGIQERDLVPYSFRHYFITQKVNSNLPPSAVAEMCGTSISQIEKTYYHTTLDKMISNAIADYDYIDGVLVPK